MKSKSIYFIVFLLISIGTFAQPANDEQLAVQYFQSGDFEKASDIFGKIYISKPSPFIYDYYLKCLIELKDFKRAEKMIQNAQKREPENQMLPVDLGTIFHLEGNEDKAQKQYENAIKKVPPYKDIIDNLAAAFIKNKLTDYAFKTYEHGKKLLKDPLAFSLEIAELNVKTNNLQLAVDNYLDYIEAQPDEVETVKNILQDLILNDPNQTSGELIRTALLLKIKKNPDVQLFSDLLIWYFVQVKEFNAAVIQAKAVDKRFSEDGSRLFNLAGIASSNGFYEEAIECYDYIVQKKGIFSPYYESAQLEELNVKFLKVISSAIVNKTEILALEKEYKDVLKDQKENDNSLKLLINLAHLDAFYLDSTNEAVTLLNKGLTFRGVSRDIQAKCKIELGDILVLQGSVWDASLLYMQVDKDFKNDVTGFDAKFRNARLYYFINEFDYAKAQLDILKAATAKLIANDAMALALLIGDNMDADSTYVGLSLYAHAELLVFQHKYDDALVTLDSINTIALTHPLFDEVLYKKAYIKIQQEKFSEADSLLTKVVQFYPDDILADDALFLSAELNENKLGNPEKAKELYYKLITDMPGSIFVVEARKRYRNLRGDKIN